MSDRERENLILCNSCTLSDLLDICLWMNVHLSMTDRLNNNNNFPRIFKHVVLSFVSVWMWTWRESFYISKQPDGTTTTTKKKKKPSIPFFYPILTSPLQRPCAQVKPITSHHFTSARKCSGRLSNKWNERTHMGTKKLCPTNDDSWPNLYFLKICF